MTNITCDLCNKSFQSIKGLRGHQWTHGETFIKCSCIFTKEELLVRNLDRYVDSLVECKLCNKLFKSKYNAVFCSSSCSASYNNVNVRRHGGEPLLCLLCGKKTSTSKSKYCSNKCHADARRKSIESKRKRIRINSAHYRCKLRNQTPVSADKLAIKNFYDNCPIGYEVDHIIPISKGGLHTIENLQYLTISENRKKNNKILDRT